jgi:hypothetical protein
LRGQTWKAHNRRSIIIVVASYGKLDVRIPADNRILNLPDNRLPHIGSRNGRNLKKKCDHQDDATGHAGHSLSRRSISADKKVPARAMRAG